MKGKAIILNYMKYVKKDKDTGIEQPMTRIEFLIDELQESKKRVGYSVVSCYYKGFDVYDRLSKGLLKKEVDVVYEFSQDMFNPLALRRMLKKINGVDLY